jgi:hypothetical protein
MKDISGMHDVMCIGRRVRACTRLSEAAKALITRDHVIGISGTSTPLNRSRIEAFATLALVLTIRREAWRCGRSSSCKVSTDWHVRRLIQQYGAFFWAVICGSTS